MNRRPLQLALREMHAAATSRYTRIGMVLAAVLLAVSGPFGTFGSFNLGQRVAYWAAMVVGGYLVGQGAASFFIEVLRPRIAQKWPRAIVAGLLTGLPVTLVVALVNTIAYQRFDATGLALLWLYATIVTLLVTVALVGVAEIMAGAATAAMADPAVPATTANPTTPPGPNPPGPLAPPILERVPLPQRGRLLALVVEDHYVDIVTDKGKTLVLMRLADAIREAGTVAGLQIHRSHWVARDAVIKTHRRDGKLSLELSNGLRLPVSRGYLPAVRAAGLSG